ncbi:MAG: hypothetical protein KJ583_04915 [Nanoarchaeota archaeon]|nr:hypothetical protein [Nanoarchaeota archaeon]MBU1269881.1 hypothetical protein [Nanoarchaeota archaeon]MBU1604631.1 hypothetical protein [Nanoarchaeota archaeon]MBU2443056.1 hypothetical protein [Nanoarchaeota archaeon]
MISFACKKIELKDLIKCSFDLNKTDYVVFNFLMKKNKEFSVEKIAKALVFERSSVQKAIQKLVFRNLVLRRQVNLEQGGYKFFYSINDREEIKRRIQEIIDGWHRKVKEAIKDWG